MKLLVTGALGHIGSKLIREYSKREDIELIRMLDNLSTQRFCSLFNLPEKKKYEFIEGDITNRECIKSALKGIDVVIHLAAITDAPSTLNNSENTFKINLEGTKILLEESAKAGVKKFLFPSTTSVYGEAEGVVDELTSDLRPQSPYAEAKLKAEQEAVMAYKNLGLHTIILRMGTIFGISEGMRFHTAVNKFCFLASLGKPLTVWDSALNSKRPYLDLEDDISAFHFLEKNGKPGEIYNVLTKNFTMGEIIEAIKRAVPDVRIEVTKSPILNQKPYHVSDEKLKKLGFIPRGDLNRSIKETVDLFKAINNFS